MTFVASPKTLAIGIFAGLASALLVLSPVGGSMLSVPLTILAQLPLVIASLGWGTIVGVVATLAGAGTLAAISPNLALYFLLFLAPAAVVGSHLIGLSRTLEFDPDSTTVGPGTIKEWYPIGRALLIVAALVVVGSCLVSIADGFDPSSVSETMTRGFAEQYAADVKGSDDSVNVTDLANTLQPAISTMFRVLPFAFTMTWTLVAAVNLWLGILSTRKSGNLIRPREDLAAIDIPRVVAAIFAGGLVVGLIGGWIGAIGGAVAGAMAALLLIAGLSVLHTVTRPLSFRLPLIVLVYLFLGICAVPLLIVGAVEPYARLRQRMMPRSPSPPSKP